MNRIQQAWDIAQNEDVSSRPNSVVLYSISYLETDANKRNALKYIESHPESVMLDQTPCGRKLIALGMETDHKIPDADIMKVWQCASKRFIESAAGNIMAFVESADKRSTFVSTELPAILRNERILTINEQNKQTFAQKFI